MKKAFRLTLLHKLFLANLSVLSLVLIFVIAINYINFKWLGDQIIPTIHHQESLLMVDLAQLIEQQIELNQNWLDDTAPLDSWRDWLNTQIPPLMQNYPELSRFIAFPAPDVNRDFPQHNRAFPPKPPMFDIPPRFTTPVGHPPEMMGARQLAGVNFISHRLIITDDKNRILLGERYTDDIQYKVQLTFNTKVKGWLILQPANGAQHLMSPITQRFKDITIILIITVLLSLLVSYLLAKHITAPIKSLTEGAIQLSKRQFETEIEVKTTDELSELAKHFNHLSRKLKVYDNLQKNWLQDIAHELRTPLTIMQGQIEAMQDGVLSPDKENIDQLHRDVMRLNRLVEDLNALGKSEITALKLDYQNFDLSKLIVNAVNSMTTRLNRRGLKVELTLETLVINADDKKLHQVLMNLLENCYRYTRTSGTVNIQLSLDNNIVRLEVADNGPGVANDKLAYIFERLYRADDARKDSEQAKGLGLAITRNIINAHGGTITALNNQSGGLTIVIELPLTVE